MKYLFNQQGLELLEAHSFTKTLYAFDFDGTLAPITREPGSAKLSRTTVKLLKELSATSPVAVISGRSRADLKSRLPSSVKWTIGNHGLEGVGIQKQKLQKAKSVVQRWKDILMDLLQAPEFRQVELEDKGVSLSLHYRKCRKKREVKAQLTRAIGKFKEKPRIVLGKSVLNLIPEGAPHKGIALQELMKKLKMERALFFGDDETDEDVFSMGDERIFSVRVGLKKTSRAKFYLKRQSEMNELLKQLVQFEREPRS